MKKVLEIANKCPDLEKIVVMEDADADKSNPKVMTFTELMELGRKKHAEDPALFEKLADEVDAGRPGDPRVHLRNHRAAQRRDDHTRNIFWVVQSLDAIRPHFASDKDCTVPFLPLSHVFERIAGHFYGMYCGITASYAESIDTLLADFEEKRPTMILAVPRVCEKVYQKIMAQVQEQSPFKQKVFAWGQKVGNKISKRREMHKGIPLLAQVKVQDRVRHDIQEARRTSWAVA